MEKVTKQGRFFDEDKPRLLHGQRRRCELLAGAAFINVDMLANDRRSYCWNGRIIVCGFDATNDPLIYRASDRDTLQQLELLADSLINHGRLVAVASD